MENYKYDKLPLDISKKEIEKNYGLCEKIDFLILNVIDEENLSFMKVKEIEDLFEEYKNSNELFESQDFEKLNNFNGVKDSTSSNYLVYKEIIKVFPHIENIIDSIGANAQYALYNIWDDNNRIVFNFHRSMYINIQKIGKDLIKYSVEFEVPGNQNYNFSVSINKK